MLNAECLSLLPTPYSLLPKTQNFLPEINNCYKMRLSHKHKFLFIGKPRSGDTMIRQALDPYSDSVSTDKGRHNHPHVPASILKQYFKRMGWDWNSYFKFTSVRNPWDMLVSVYSFGNPDQNGFYFWEKQQYNPNKKMPFTEWITKGKSWDIKAGKHLTDLSAYSLSYSALDDDNTFLVDYVIRFENLESDLTFLESMLGLKLNCPKIEQHKRDDYTNYYNQESIDRVANLFWYDIKYGNYKFGMA
ncbi:MULTISPECIES: sulfotransferase family 2 domain-containing protein [unclassified Moorena]|uniref:sulfotransferase family 2 domain-containing protein n=1 Tax=unclassified Moorena TaxID=2683338 RepID=UPI0013B7072C|nr:MULTISPECIES: sulfotransferase family 2 domain-containing protein [unclassified Moorena]NEP33605.1 hypothetical protein [Moorena sp. SIO3B2]NEP65630.1 hypothetical protein [Moorena sp. SIO3A5]NER86017.1 hypothetical protein [Moorena sp. SIO3A2]